jgi:hypothetical protein
MERCAFLMIDAVATSLHLLVLSLLYEYLPSLAARLFPPSNVIWYSEVYVNE